MKKIVLAAFAAAVAVPAVAAPGDTAEATGQATAEIVAPITITNTGSGLNFGTIAVEAATGGTIAVAFDGSATEGGAGGAGLVPGGTATSADQFTVTGESGLLYSIVIDPSVTLSGGTGPDMTASLLAESSGGTIGGASDVFAVGGTLTVPAGQGGGLYTGTYTVTASYD